PVIMVRGKDDTVRLFFNVCRHRGSKVCYESYGSASRFRCMYHGWTYDTTGELIGVPLRERYQDFEPENTLGLIPVPRVESYRGFVFASLNREGPSLAEHLGRGRHYLDLMCERAPDGEIEVTRPIKCDFFGNWKLSIENFSDNYHPSILHRSALEVGVNMLTQKYGDQKITLGNASNYAERTYGAGHGMQDFGRTRGAMWMNAYANPGYLDALQAKHGATRARELAEMDVHIIIYPNLLLATRMNNFRVVKPVAVDRSEVWTYPCKLKGAPADVNEQIVLNASHHVSAMGEIQVDDLQCFTWIQEGLQAEAMEWILLKLHGKDERMNEFGEFEWQGASEEIIRHQYREWLRLMG
ncbi:MAG TPA: aromatic ring-hydroxylating dioxygenase subunit alpha, partial [Candidatus Binatia bacterium]|nr:aromatic ring-hydroxylating dioxygenase subunit alpha [Candidatus Binatia bacterium]